jgi:hypothetical protein
MLLKPLLARYRPRRSFARGQNYPQLLQKLIVEGLIRIEENDENEENEVTVFCHGEDEATVKKVLPAAVKEYVEFMKQESTVLLEQPVVSINADCTNDLTDNSYGGIVLTDDRATKQCLGTASSSLHLESVAANASASATDCRIVLATTSR